MADRISAHYRVAEPGELTGCRVAAVQRGPADSVVVIIDGSHATPELLDQVKEAAGYWVRLPDTPENRSHPCRILHAGWKLIEDLPDGLLCLPTEARHRHEQLIREGEATFRLAADVTWLLTRMVRSEVWIRAIGA
ncbi:hypothetical protein [Streptomyces sp. C10-9-1]|uniref:hypothetical protein n=1 Tax=Streptomyces sp. C10-9-1 TaxID=1859285 RepID=UPI003F4A293F